MSNLEKALLNVDGEHVDITVPFTKANQEKRTIIGIATADAVDHAGDVVTWAASKKAFETTTAAIREQHQKNKTVGKIVGFEAKSVYDPETKKVVNVIEVEAYISRTAEDTWTKINEGILKGFSIGGNVSKSEERVSKSDPTKSYRYITDYTLTELSVVDNPCSPQARIMTINKALDADTGEQTDDIIIKGMAAEVETENVFWNPATRELRVTKDAELAGYENIGWIETSKSLDDEVRSEQLATIVNAHLDLAKSDEGGVTNMSEKEVTEETVEEVPTETVEETPEVKETEKVEEPVVEEVPSEGTDIQKMIDELRDLRSTIAETIEKAVTQSSEETHESLAQVNSKLEKAEGALNTELTALSEKYEALSKSVTNLNDKFESIEKSIDALEADTAIKKSGDLGGSTEIKKNKESLWANSALSLRDL
jgi:hypothetical protein